MDLKAHLQNRISALKEDRTQFIERAILLTTVEAGTRHLGHNLGVVAAQIAGVDERIDEAESLLRRIDG